MELGFVSAILPDLSLEEVLAAGVETGYDCVELMCWPRGRADRRYAGVTHIDVSAFDAAEASRVWDAVDRSGLDISGLGYYPNALAPSHEESEIAVAHLRRVISAAHMLDLDVVSTFIGRDWTCSVDDNWPRFIAIWKDIIAFAADKGIRIAIENCPMLFTKDEWPGGKNLAASPAIWRRMFNDIPSENFGLNYDPSHLLWQQMDYIAPLDEFAARIFRIHLKDAAVNREQLNSVGILATPLEFHAPRLPGSGDIDWKQFVDAVVASGYDGPLNVEVEDRRYEGDLASRKEALRLSAGHIRPLLAAHARRANS
jgi:sugar phosphate isomerase/epimerase